MEINERVGRTNEGQALSVLFPGPLYVYVRGIGTYDADPMKSFLLLAACFVAGLAAVLELLSTIHPK